MTLYEKYLDQCQMYSLRITGNSYAKKCILETINSNMSLILLQQCTSTIMRQRNKEFKGTCFIFAIYCTAL
ncbi:hypothetical protein V1477_015266 [Vespula maculifrons]|uniref:Uncharacterized protein n=1 Tax=Vespula maculifrons TaxID=7453 RepID=A0ABD2BJS5_VESMC